MESSEVGMSLAESEKMEMEIFGGVMRIQREESLNTRAGENG